MLAWLCLAVGLHCAPSGEDPSAMRDEAVSSSRAYVTASFSELATGHERRVDWSSGNGVFGRVEWGQLRNGVGVAAAELGWVRRVSLLPGAADFLVEVALAGLHVATSEPLSISPREILAASTGVGLELRAGPLVLGVTLRGRHGLTAVSHGGPVALRLTVRTEEG